MTEDLILGLGRHHNTYDLFRDAKNVTTDEWGNIFVADGRSSEVIVYREDGQFMRRIGAWGRAPGEFVDINIIGQAAGRGIVIADARTNRFSWYDARSDSFSVHPFPLEVRPTGIRQLPGGSFLIRHFNLDLERHRDDQPDSPLLHEYDIELRHIVASFGHIADFTDPEDRMMRAIYQFGPGFEYLVLDDSTVVTAPTLYDGGLNVYSRASSGTWHVRNRWAGLRVDRVYTQRSTEDLPETEAELLAYDFPREGFTLSGPYGLLMVELHSQSRGLARGPGGTVLHFTLQQGDQVATFGVEVFERNGDFRGYQSLATSPATAERWEFGSAILRHQDSSGRLYFRDAQGGVPVIRRMIVSF